jgi:ubiquinone biosynthesis protein COQ9
MRIIKNSGDIVDFDPKKLRKSLVKSGAGELIVEDILYKIRKEIYDGISTKKIYKRAFTLLKKEANSHAARYNLRSGLQLLGPAGFFFEKYIARLFESEGYQTVTNSILSGKCVSHEIDVLIKKDNELAMVECKFHSARENKSSVKVSLYVFSRFNDLKERKQIVFLKNEIISTCWIVTNNRFTSDAIDFAKCSGMNLLSWDYPKDNNLKTKNDIDCLYPVTCLTTLSLAEKDKLLILDVILARELVNNSEQLGRIGLSANRIKNVLKEVRELVRCI